MMTKMAIYEKNEGRKMIKNARYFKGDYIAFGILKTLIATTFAYIIMMVLYALCNAEALVEDFNTLDYGAIGQKAAVYYVIMVVIFGVVSGIVYNYQYEKSRAGLKRYFSRLNKLERFYKSQRKK
ncbi:MAG: hypothetical protein Q4F11_01140 [Eubacteriales bacterium]|nr:hypothetical protein [Eubacteriales bacterium]